MSISKEITISVDFITLSRSDFASIKPIIKESLKEKNIKTGLIAGGSHLLKRFGRSIDRVLKEFKIDEVVSFLGENDDDEQDFAKAYSCAVNEFVRVLSQRNPDLIFIVGDRWELLAASTAATMLRIPIAHHSGGDITQGSSDNQTRYVLSTLSHLHYVALAEHAERLKIMGEEAWRIKVTGEPALTQIYDILKSPINVRKRLGLKNNSKFILATFHPTSYDEMAFEEQIEIYKRLLSNLDFPIVLTAPNPDQGSATFYEILKNISSNNEHIRFFEHLGAELYYSAMSEASLMIGNSSSGLWEAPSFKLPVVNIGRRQDARVRANNVIDVELNVDHIMEAVNRGMSLEFRNSLAKCTNPYVNPDTNSLIINNLLLAPSKERLLFKKFIDPIITVHHYK